MVYFLASIVITGIAMGLGIYVFKTKDQASLEKKEDLPKTFSFLHQEYPSPGPDLMESQNSVEQVKNFWTDYCQSSTPQLLLETWAKQAKEIRPDFPDPPSLLIEENNGEKILKKTMQTLFPGYLWLQNKRPEWLVNPKTGRRLELDVFCPELEIAAEYNGEQHYDINSIWNKTEKMFQEQVYRDQIKRDLCHQKKIYLLTVPYWVKKTQIPAFVYCQLLQSL